MREVELLQRIQKPQIEHKAQQCLNQTIKLQETSERDWLFVAS
jgi:hypothetical protein